MSEGSSSIDAIVCSIQPRAKRWTPIDRVPQETVRAVSELGNDNIVSAIERTAVSDRGGTLIAAIWTVSCPGLPWTEKLIAALAKAQLRCNDADFEIVQLALRQIELDSPDLAVRLLRSFFLGESKHPDEAIVLLFVFLKTGIENPALLIQSIKRACVKKKEGRRTKRSVISVDGLLFGALLSETRVSMVGVRGLVEGALVEFDELSWRADADDDQLIHLCRDLVALLCLTGDKSFFEAGTRAIVRWLADLGPHQRASMVLGRVVTLLEEGLGFWYPWLYSSSGSLLESIRNVSWASPWVRDLELRLNQLQQRPEESKLRPAPVWRRWMEIQEKRI